MSKTATAPKKAAAAAPAPATPKREPQPSAAEKLAALDPSTPPDHPRRKALEEAAWLERARDRNKNPLSATAPEGPAPLPDARAIFNALASAPGTADGSLGPTDALYWAQMAQGLTQRQPQSAPTNAADWVPIIQQLQDSGQVPPYVRAASYGGVEYRIGSQGELTAIGRLR